MFGHPSIKDRLNEIHRLLGRLTNRKYDDHDEREEAVKKIRWRLLNLIKAEQQMADIFKSTLKELDEKVGL